MNILANLSKLQHYPCERIVTYKVTLTISLVSRGNLTIHWNKIILLGKKANKLNHESWILGHYLSLKLPSWKTVHFSWLILSFLGIFWSIIYEQNCQTGSVIACQPTFTLSRSLVHFKLNYILTGSTSGWTSSSGWPK